jgi:hypothetical protein
MIFQILFGFMLSFASFAQVRNINVNEINYNKNEIITDDIIHKSRDPVNKIVMTRNSDYIELAQYLVLRENNHNIVSNSEDVVQKIQQKKQNEESINQDFFYKTAFIW